MTSTDTALIASPTQGVSPWTQADIYDYARSVRAGLADLGPGVVAEMTDGLEADLAESLAEHPEPVGAEDLASAGGALDAGASGLSAWFGSPAQYAAELRLAAGLPVTGIVPDGVPLDGSLTETSAAQRRADKRAARARRRAQRKAQERWAGTRRRVSNTRSRWNAAWAPLTSTPGWQAFREWRSGLSPIWWALRGWIVGSFLTLAVTPWSGTPLLPNNAFALLFTLFVTVLSIQWGRGRWLPWRWLPRLATVMSIAAVLLAVPLYVTRDHVTVYSDGSNWEAGFQAGQESVTDQGFWANGEQVINIFAYDADGFPVPLVQLFDQAGRPIATGNSSEDDYWRGWFTDATGAGWHRIPHTSVDGRTWWNVFPQNTVWEGEFTDMDESGAPVHPVAPAWPFLRAGAVFDISGMIPLEGTAGASVPGQEQAEVTETPGATTPGATPGGTI